MKQERHRSRRLAGLKTPYRTFKEIYDVSISANRAFVFVRNFEAKAIKEANGNQLSGWTLFPCFENSGATLARNVEYRINFSIFEMPLDLGFEFPDYGDVNDLECLSISSKQVIYGKPIELDASALKKLADKTRFAYIWCWLDYDDIFTDTPRHRSELCCQVTAVGDLQSERCELRYQRYGQFNGFDDECVRKPRAYIRPSYYKFSRHERRRARSHRRFNRH